MTGDSGTDPDPVTEVCDDKSVDSKELLDPIAFVAVKAETTVSYSFFLPHPTFMLNFHNCPFLYKYLCAYCYHPTQMCMSNVSVP
jgi:hypothetical protein